MKSWKRAIPWIVGGTVGGFLAVNLLFSVMLGRNLVRPKRKRNRTSDLSTFVPEASYNTYPVHFYSLDGVQLAGLLLEPNEPNGHAIIVCHGLRHDKNSAVRFVQYLAREGYTLLLVDFRNHGESGGEITSYGYYEKYDLHGAVDFLRSRVKIPGQIGILGASMGASIALMAAVENDAIRALVLDSPFSSLKKITLERVSQLTHLPAPILRFPMNLTYQWIQRMEHIDLPSVEPGQKAKELRCPLFLIHGEKDNVIPADHSREIFQNAETEKELWIVENVGHLGSYPANPHEYQKRVIRFFEKNLKHPA
jgi:fermentation-respiration switch protein FrsA (DUF1100 family)